MNNRIILLQIAVIISLLAALSFVSKSCLDGRAEKARLETNLANYDTQYTDLNLTKSEIQTELNKRKAQYNVVDSLLRAEKATTKQLTRLYLSKVIISNTDTVYLTNPDTPTFRDTTGVKQYKTPFADSRNCISITGFVLSTDSAPSVVVTAQNAAIETYDLTIKRRWWQFWKPRTWTRTFTRCGDLEVIRMEVK